MQPITFFASSRNIPTIVVMHVSAYLPYSSMATCNNMAQWTLPTNLTYTGSMENENNSCNLFQLVVLFMSSSRSHGVVSS